MDYFLFVNETEKLSRKSSSSRCSVWLPCLVFVRVCIITDAPYNKTWKIIHQPSRLHLETNNPLSFSYFVPGDTMLHHLISRCNITIGYLRIRACTRVPFHYFLDITFVAGLVALVIVVGLE